MRNFKLSTAGDTFFIFIAIFAISYATLIKNKVKFLGSLALSVIIAVALTGLVLLLLIKINDKKSLNELYSNEKQNLITYLTLLPRDTMLNFFIKAYENSGLFLEIFNDGLLIKSKNAYLYPLFNASETTIQNVVEAYRKKGDYHLIFISGSYETGVSNYLLNLNDVTLCDGNDLYATIKKLNALPTFNQPKINKFDRFLNIIKGLFNKKHAKFFFLTGIVTLLSSTLTYFKTYYIITGIILLIISAICKFFAPSTKKTIGITL